MIFYPKMSTTLDAFSSPSSDRAADEHHDQPPDTSPSCNEDVTLSEEDIGVTLDYEPPPASTYYVDTSNSRQEAESRRSANRRMYEYVTHRRQHRRQRRSNESFFRFYSKHWLGQCIAALLTGLIFMSIGIVFVTTEITSAYIGVMFMLVSLPSFFMSLHMVRSKLQQQRLRRMYMERQRRRMARRRRRRGGAEDAAYRSNDLPYADLPPSYDNLGFSDNDFVNGAEPDGMSLGTSSDVSEGAPPTYDNDWDKASLDDIEMGDLNETITTEDKPNPSTDNKTVSETSSLTQQPTCSHLE